MLLVLLLLQIRERHTIRFFIYGGVGLGKTHLLNAIGNFLIKHGNVNPDRICYITAETFTNELINSIRYRKNGRI